MGGPPVERWRARCQRPPGLGGKGGNGREKKGEEKNFFWVFFFINFNFVLSFQFFCPPKNSTKIFLSFFGF